MLTMRPRFATVLVWFRPVVLRHSPYAVFLMNRDESEWIGMSVIPRFTLNAHEWLLLPHLKYEPGAAMVNNDLGHAHNSAAPVAEWVRSLNFSALNHSIISPL